MDKECVQEIADVFKEKRPAWPVQWKHLAIAAYVIPGTGGGGNKEQSTKQGKHNHGCGYMASIPTYRTLKQIENHSQQGTHHNHGMQAYQTPFEEVAEAHVLTQTVVVGIAYDKARQDEKEINSQVAVVNDSNRCSSGSKDNPSKMW